jgi:transposase
MGQKRKHYTDEFKIEAVRLLIDSGKPISVIAKELGVSEYLLSRWKREIQSDAPGNGKTPILSRDEEIQKLRRELKRVTDERDFLKKTATYFAKESK